ncbi:MAG TPA: phosphatase domain-containing protein [Gemmatimonadaceae bacterium]
MTTPGWRERLLALAAQLEGRVDAAMARRADRAGRRDPLVVHAYRGYGTSTRVRIRGRVLEDEGIPAAGERDSMWRNMLSAVRRFETDEVPGARVGVRFANVTQELVTDAEGYFDTWITPREALPGDTLWHDVALELLAPRDPSTPPRPAIGRVLIPPATARLGVISDLDDTVVQTGATDPRALLRSVFLTNARTRLPFPGVAALYRALQEGAGGGENNPVFYVSSSPWNLHDVLAEFLAIREIPEGPIMLRDWGLSERELLPTSHGSHKIEAIRGILDLYPTLPFVLIGDSGQEDPEIYREIVARYPSRILAIYIRNVTPDARRAERIRALGREVTAARSELLLAAHTGEVAAHALDRGWVDAAALERVLREVDGT